MEQESKATFPKTRPHQITDLAHEQECKRISPGDFVIRVNQILREEREEAQRPLLEALEKLLEVTCEELTKENADRQTETLSKAAAAIYNAKRKVT
jgi:hypothetical protein